MNDQILLIAPAHTDLTLAADEFQEVINQLRPVYVLQGEISEGDVIRALNDNGPFGGAWVISHANEDIVELSNSETMPHSALAVALAAGGASWVVLNACKSEGGAIQYTSRGIDVVAVEQGAGGEIEDRAAWRMGRLLAQALADTGDLGVAFEQVRGIDNRYRYYEGGSAVRTTQGGNVLQGILQEQTTETRLLRAEMEGVRRAIEKQTDAHSALIWTIAILAAICLGLIVLLGFETVYLFRFMLQELANSGAGL